MRNLKKILAMALALIMSLSLMATTSAADFKDADKINDTYRVAVDVLEGLKVFRGYSNGNFEPTGSITRAETAAIIYRIVTGDVDDKQVGIYKDYNLFKDVSEDAWYAGYVNFCANAQYIKGDGKGNFNPQEKVEGYAALAMILRAIGYTANGGFIGPDWRTQTARVGKSRGITNNITEGTLGKPADRQTVAEILFQSILVDMVDHNVDQTLNGEQGYNRLPGQTLGKKTFGLEKLQGIVVANEYADLNSNQVLPNGQTKVLFDGEESPSTLSISTEITAIGERRLVYTTNRSGVVKMYDKANGYGADLNKVIETGKAVDISTNAKFQAVAEMAQSPNTEFYIDFDNRTAYDCDYRLEFQVTFQSATAEQSFNRYIGKNIAQIAASDDNWDVKWTLIDPANPPAGTKYPVTYHQIIRAHDPIIKNDLDVIRGIFGAADNAPGLGDNNIINQIDGDVYVGTKSTNVTTTITLPGGTTGVITTNGEQDVSNLISYDTFYAEYINVDDDTCYWNTSYNGEWVKFVDNNLDGKADYAFKTQSWLDEAIGAYTNKDDVTVTEFIRFDDDNDPRAVNDGYQVRYMDGYTPTVGDKVVYASIDNQILVAPAKNETVKVKDYSWREDKISTDKGDYYQSGIYNNTDMPELIKGMEDNVSYIVYFDHFGYVRAYELPGGTRYALVTELYYSNNQYGNLIQEWPMTVELTMPNADGKAEKKEYPTSSRNVFNTQLFLGTPWFEVISIAANRNYYNWLQPAIAHLGVGYTAPASSGLTPLYRGAMNGGVDGVTDPTLNQGTQYCFWTDNYQRVNKIDTFGTSQEFRYGPQKYSNVDVTNTTSFTNVAVVTGEDTVSLSGAAKLHVNKDGTLDPEWYDVDYIQLSTADIAKAAVRYNIENNITDTYEADNNLYVNATHDTEYYIAYNGDVFYCKDYVNFPGLTNKDNVIHAAYAVARDTRSDKAGEPYWVADVIVYEVEKMDDTNADHIALAYYTQERISGTVQRLKTLDSKYTPIMEDLVPTNKAWNAELGQWGRDWDGYGFYTLYNTTAPAEEGDPITARKIEKIGEGNYNKNGIFAGTVIREVKVTDRGDYIVVELDAAGGTRTVEVEITDKVFAIESGTSWDGKWDNEYNTARQLRYKNTNNPEVKTGDRVIWVGKANDNGTVSTASFVVDLGNDVNSGKYANSELRDNTAGFLQSWTWNAVAKQYDICDPNTNVMTRGTNDVANDSGNLPTGLWQQIVREQRDSYVAPVDIPIHMTLGANEKAEITADIGGSVTFDAATDDSDTPAGLSKDLTIPGGHNSFTLTIKMSGSATVTLGAVTVGSGWTTSTPVQIGATEGSGASTVKTYKVLVGRTSAMALAADPNAAEKDFTDALAAPVRIYSVQGATDLATWATTNVAALTDEQIAALDTLLTGIKDATTVDTVESAVTSTIGTLDGQALTNAKTDAATKKTSHLNSALAAANASAVTDLTTSAQAAIATAESAYTTAVNDSEATVDDVATALQDYKDAVDAAVELNNAQAAAKTAAAKLITDAELEVPAENVDSALNTAYKALLAKINACTVDGASDTAIATYWDAAAEALKPAQDQVKALTDAIAAAKPNPNAVTVTLQGTNVKLADDQAEIVKDTYGPTIKLECSVANSELPANADDNKVQIRMEGGTLANTDWTYTPNGEKTAATIALGFGVKVTGNITIAINATGKAITPLANISVNNDTGAITTTNTDTTGLGTVKYYLAPKTTDVTTWTQLTPATTVDAFTEVTNTGNALTCTANGKKLVAVGIKEGVIVAAGSSSEIAINKSTIAITGNGVTAPDATGVVDTNKITVDLTNGTDVTLSIANGTATWTEVPASDPKEFSCTFNFTLTNGFVATGANITSSTGGTYTVVVTKQVGTAPTTGTETVTIHVAVPTT